MPAALPRACKLGRHAAGGIAVAGDIEPVKHRRELQRREMIGRQRGDHRHAGQRGLQAGTLRVTRRSTGWLHVFMHASWRIRRYRAALAESASEALSA
jgi:hypothetical protein